MTLTELRNAFVQLKTADEEQQLSPNSYRRKTGRCPQGFVGDARGRCVRARKLKQRLFGKVRHRGRKRRSKSKSKRRLASRVPILSQLFQPTTKKLVGVTSVNQVDYDLLDDAQKKVLLNWWIEPTVLPAPDQDLANNEALAAWLNGPADAYYVNISWCPSTVGDLGLPAQDVVIRGKPAKSYIRNFSAVQFKRALPRLQRAWKKLNTALAVKNRQKERLL